MQNCKVANPEGCFSHKNIRPWGILCVKGVTDTGLLPLQTDSDGQAHR